MADEGDRDGSSGLRALCDLLGVRARYEAAGEPHESPERSVRAALRELGAPVSLEPGSSVDDALRSLTLERWTRPLEPVSVAWEGAAATFTPVRLPVADAEEPLELRVALEDGAVAERRVDADELRWDEEVEVEGATYRRGRLRLPDLPTGRHAVTIRTASARESTTTVLRAPGATWDGPAEGNAEADDPTAVDGWREWGVFLPLYALRTERDRGVGDLGDLEALTRWVRELGGSTVATLPLLAAFQGGPDGAGPVEASPYSPVSRLFWNELYLDLDSLPGLGQCPEARRILESAAHRGEAGRLRAMERVDHAAVMAHKRKVLEPLALSVAGGAVDGSSDVWPEGLVAGRPELLDYARFRAVGEDEGRSWPDWPEAAAERALDPAAVPDERVAYHVYVQWAMEEQIRRLPELHLDLPLGCHPDGYDVWRHREAFATGVSGGAPPDAFFAGGQDWGFPPLHPLRSREDGHAYFAASLRHLMSACDTLRIDHVMSLHRLFWVPGEASPADGVYVRYPSDELWAVTCLESRRNRCEVVGEDLGTVPAEVPAAMRRRRARRTWVLPFECGAGDEGETARLDPPPARSVATLGTHDMAPFASFWEGGDVERRVEDGHLDPDDVPDERAERRRWREALAALLDLDPDAPAGEVLPEALALLARSDARLVVVNLEDLWLEREPQNVPGTTGPRNWTRRAARSLDEIRDDDRIREILENVHRLRIEPPGGNGA